MDFIVDNEPIIRLSAFISIFGLMALLEIWLPRRARSKIDGKPVKASRWFSHGALTIVNSVTLRLIFPAAAVGTAVYAETNGWGLFNVFDAPLIIAFAISFLVLDFSVWLEPVSYTHLTLPTIYSV